MSKLDWSDRKYSSGIDRGIFYPRNSPGEVWNGLISVEELPSPQYERKTYVDGVKFVNKRRDAPFSANVSAYSAPDSFFNAILTQKRNQGFGFSYRTLGKINIIYNATASPSKFEYTYVDPDAYSWLITTFPIPLPGSGFTSQLIVDTSIAYPSAIADLEDILYGTDLEDARLPAPAEVLEIFEENSILRVIDNGDGTFTVIGPDEVITMLDLNTFEITWPSAVYTDIFEEKYKLRSL
jgi:hypothetical protein